MQLTKLNQEQAKYTRILRRSGHTLMRIIDDILDYSKIEVGKLLLENTQFNMTQLIEDSVSFLDAKVIMNTIKAHANTTRQIFQL